MIELAIVVVIVGILATIAYPSYRERVREAARRDAQGALMQLAQSMERYYTENNTYLGGGAALPYNQSPVDSNNPRYNLGLQNVTATTYILQAVPIQGDPTCGTMTLNNTGARTPAGCW